MSNIKTCLRKNTKKMLFQQFLHNKQLKFGLLVPVGLLMHEQSQKKDHPFTHNPTTEKVLHKKMNINQK